VKRVTEVEIWMNLIRGNSRNFGYFAKLYQMTLKVMISNSNELVQERINEIHRYNHKYSIIRFALEIAYVEFVFEKIRAVILQVHSRMNDAMTFAIFSFSQIGFLLRKKTSHG
jgi:hypothetical protein